MEDEKRKIEGIIFYDHWRIPMEMLPPARFGMLVKSFLLWAWDGIEPTNLDETQKMFFAIAKKNAKKDFEKYDAIVEKRREAGKKGGLKRVENFKQNQANQANASNFKQTKQNQANQANNNNNHNNNNNNNHNNNNNLTINSESVIERTPTLENVLQYAKNMMIDGEMAKKFFYHYDAVEWIDGNGSKIKNWQSKLQSWQMNDSIKEQDKQKKQDKNDRSMWQERLLREHEEELRKQQVI